MRRMMPSAVDQKGLLFKRIHLDGQKERERNETTVQILLPLE